MKIFLVNGETDGQRIDVWLAEQLQESRNQVQRLLAQSDVFVNNRQVSGHYILKIGDEIRLVEKARIREEKKMSHSDFEDLCAQIEIIKDTDDYIVINKPAGLVMHQAPGVTTPSIVDWLLEKYPFIRSVGEDPERPGIVHRLDREVSGLVVMAKNQAMFDHLKEQFQKRTIVKKYIALVHGSGLPLEGSINFRLERSSQGFKMAAKPVNQSGKVALTLFTIERQFHNYTLVKVEIKTGRTHQIRAHFSAYGHPVVGDDLYAGQKLRELNKKLHIGRVFLVATELGFKDVNGEIQSFSTSLPSYLNNILKTLP